MPPAPDSRTKIIATLGPATDDSEKLAALFEAGVDVLRLNFSHGDHAEHARRIARVREVAARVGATVALLQDLQGPKIRTGPLEGGGPVELEAGAELCISTRDAPGNARVVGTSYAELPRDVKPSPRTPPSRAGWRSIGESGRFTCPRSRTKTSSSTG